MILNHNAVNEQDMKRHIDVILDTITNVISKSLGPNGSTTIIQTGHIPVMTKDGFTILKHIKFADGLHQTIFNIIRDISLNLVMKVGDGSTSSILIANELYRLDELRAKHSLRPKEFLDIVTLCANNIIDCIKESSTPVDIDTDIYKIAKISLNGDDALANVISDAYVSVGEYGFINVDISNSEKTYFEKVRGFNIDSGYLDSLLVNNAYGECVLEGSDIFMIDEVIQGEKYIKPLAELINLYLADPKKSLTIISAGYGEDVSLMLRQIITFATEKNIRNINIIKLSRSTKLEAEIFDDLEILTSARVVKKSIDECPTEYVSYLGVCDRVISTNKITTFMSDLESNESIDDRIKLINKELTNLTEQNREANGVRIFELRKRLGLLSSNMATVYVGGKSDFEKDTVKFLVDDAVLACRSAILNGYNIGQNLAIPLATKKLRSEWVGVDIKDRVTMDILDGFDKAVFNVFSRILSLNEDKSVLGPKYIWEKCIQTESAYNVVTGKYSVTDVINSSETDIEIIKSAISIIGLIMTSNQFIRMETTEAIVFD